MSYDQPRTLGVADYFVVGGMLLCSISIGIYQGHLGRKTRQGTEGYLLGNRSISFLPVAISVAVNFKSAVTIIGIPADVYQFGTVYAWCIASLILITGPFVGYIILPVLYKLKISSAYEYLEKRYGRPIRLIATSGFMIQTLFYMGLNVYGPALALSRVTGFPQIVAMLTTGFVCITYTTMGGLRGVVWSDVFQALLMATAMLAFVIRGTITAGGAGAVWNHMIEGGRSNLESFDLDPRIRYTFWTSFFGWVIIWIGMFGTDQTNVQRYLSVKSLSKARRAMFIGTLGVAFMTTLAVACGIVLYALFRLCDPMESGCIEIRDELMPYAAMDIFRPYPGMRGLFLSGVFAASLSTVSSGLNAMVSVTVADFLKPYTAWTDSRYERISKGLTFGFGLIIIGTGFLTKVLGEMLTIAVGIVGSFFGAYLGIFLMGIWMPFVNSWEIENDLRGRLNVILFCILPSFTAFTARLMGRGAGSGFITGVVMSFVKFLGSKGIPNPSNLTRMLPVSSSFCPVACGYLDSTNMTTMYAHNDSMISTSISEDGIGFGQSYFLLSYFYTPSLGFMFTLLVGITVSLLSGGWKKRHLVDKTTIDPITCARMTRCMPAALRSFCWCSKIEDRHNDEMSETKQGEEMPLSTYKKDPDL